jgi:hypothetical protein
MPRSNRYLTVEEENTYPRFIEAEDDDEESIYPDYVLLFLHFVDYDPRSINWFKVKQFNEEFDMNLTDQQKLYLHNFQFKTKI